ncbi:MAG: TlyA family RNA methyltransferase [Solirubrobacteraceae bacterium]|nr:TlyA family RNA methyltransferase [Solirubrobacteraceae bacterium]
MARTRIDALLVERGLFESRARASAAVMAGQVLMGIGREPASKPGQLVDDEVELALRGGKEYVSRGGHKLASVLDTLGVTVEGRRWLDVGISTGGFTDCLLQRGAAHVVGIDVAYGQVAWKVSQDPRVTVVERTNARELQPTQVGEPAEAVVADVSFISLTKVLPAVARCVAPEFDALLMVKPQFEVGRDRVGKQGVVRDPEARKDAVRSVVAAAAEVGWAVVGIAPAGLPGPKGNVETFVHFVEAGRAGASPELTPELEEAIA